MGQGVAEIVGPVLAGPVLVAALVLGAAGLGKLTDPTGARQALRLARLPAPTTLVRTLALAELLTAGAVLTVGGRLPALLASASYLAFALFLVRLRRVAGPDASCGCFGGGATPSSRLHLVVDLVAAGWCAAAAVWPVPGASTLLRLPLPLAATGLVLLCTAAVLVRVVFTSLADLGAAVQALATPNATRVQGRVATSNEEAG